MATTDGAPAAGAPTPGGGGLRARLAELHPRRFFLGTWAAVDAEARASREARRAAGLGYDTGPLVALGLGAAFLVFMDTWGYSDSWRSLLIWAAGEPWGSEWVAALRDPAWRRLWEYVWWGGWRVLGFFLLPWLVLRLRGERLRDHGLRTAGFGAHAWIYAVCLAVVLPLVAAVSFTDEFSSYYPFYELCSRSVFDLVVWELIYAAQFFSLEFFFRGWWLQSCRSAMGSHAIFAMVVPYCMIHLQKPFLEALGAIVAGIVLGTLAMKTRSIWSGFLIHVTVAVSMDVASLLQGPGLPTRPWPDLP